MTTLHFVPLPFPEESPLSLIRRAALMNGYNAPRRFLSAHLGRSARSALTNPMSQNSTICRLFCEHAGEHAATIRDSFYAPEYLTIGKPRLSINGIKIHTNLIRHKGVAICTECLSEGWERHISILRLADHCPYHSRTYLNSCPVCNRQFTWYNQATNICKCKHTLISPKCSASESTLETGILELLESQSQVDFDLFNSTLNSLAIGDNTNSQHLRRLRIEIALTITKKAGRGVSRALIQLCNFKTGINIKFILAKLSHLTPKTTLNNITQELASIAPEGSTSKEIPSELTSRQVKKYFSPTYKTWNLVIKDPRFPKKKKSEPYSQECVQLIGTIIEEKEGEHHKKQTQPNEIITYAEARAILKVNADTFRDLLHSGLLGTPISSNTGPFCLRVEGINNFTSTFITIQELRQRLGTRVHAIRKQSLGNPSKRPRYLMEIYIRLYFDVATLAKYKHYYEPENRAERH